jgi:hypothetical protein
MVGTGLKKWRPTTLSGRFVAFANCEMDMDDVFEARRLSFGEYLSMVEKTFSLILGSS